MPEPINPRPTAAPHGWRVSPLASALLTGLLLSLVPVAYWSAKHADVRRALQQQLVQEGKAIEAHVLGKLRSYELVLNSVKGFYEGSSEVTGAEFLAFVQSLDLATNAQGMQGVALVLDLPADRLPQHLERMGSIGLGSYRIRPEGGRDHYAPIVYIAPFTQRNQAALGLDLRTVPPAWAALQQARDSGRPALSDRLTLAQDGGNASVAGFVLYLPIYREGAPVGTVEERREHLVGWSDGPFTLRDLVAPGSGLLAPGLRMQLFEKPDLSPASFLLGLLDGQAQDYTPPPADGLHARGTIELLGKRWTYVVEPTTQFLQAHDHRLHHGVALLGLLLSAGTGYIVWLLMTAHQRARRMAAEMTREIRQLSAHMESTLNAIPDLLFEISQDGRYLGFRTHARHTDGLDAAALVGRQVAQVLSPTSAAEVLAALQEARERGFSMGRQIEVDVAGERRWYELSVAQKQEVQPAGEEDAGLDVGERRFVVLSRDVTERVLATQQIAINERFLTEAQRVAAIGYLWIFAEEGRWEGSRGCCELMGIDAAAPPDLAGLALCIDPRHRAAFEALCRHPSTGPTTVPSTGRWDMEFRFTRPSDGATRWMHLCSQDAQGTPGETLGRFCTLQDITQRRASEDQFRLLEKAVAGLNDIVLITEAEPLSEPGPRIVFVNDAFVKRTGYTREEVLGKTPRILQGPKTQRSELARIRDALQHWQPVRAELINYTKDGSEFWNEIQIQPLADGSGWYTHWVAVERDVTERREAQARAHELAYFDALTALPNRALFSESAPRSLQQAMASQNLGAALLIDLDEFKVINDNWGHRSGDVMLRTVAQRLRDSVPNSNLVARLGGDEFMVVLDGLGRDRATASMLAQHISQRILTALIQPLAIDGREHFTSASIGIALFGDEPISMDELLSRADSAMYSAKADGRNTFRFFDSALKAALSYRADLEAELRLSIDRSELYLLYQPQVNEQGQMVGAEALCRWKSGARGAVSPADFIPLAESNGFITQLGQWVLRHACQALVALQDAAAARPGQPEVSMAVNVSARQFHHPDFVNQVLTALREAGAHPHQLKLELTESILARDVESIVGKMEALKAAGIRFSLDDFGTGYSSLSYLKKLPLDQLKIDQSFVRDVLEDPSDAAIVRTVIALGDSLGLHVIAEGVETEGQRDFLQQRGCSLYQGYLFSRPVSLPDLLDFLNAPA